MKMEDKKYYFKTSTILILLFLLNFSTLSAQKMKQASGGTFETNVNLKLSPKNFATNNPINEKALVFISGVTFTGIGIYQLTEFRDHQFDSKQVKGSIPLNPHNLLIGVGLFTISLSFVI